MICCLRNPAWVMVNSFEVIHRKNPFEYSLVAAAPTAVVATAGYTQVSVAFVAPTNTGGTAITGYTVTASPPARQTWHPSTGRRRPSLSSA